MIGLVNKAIVEPITQYLTLKDFHALTMASKAIRRVAHGVGRYKKFLALRRQANDLEREIIMNPDMFHWCPHVVGLRMKIKWMFRAPISMTAIEDIIIDVYGRTSDYIRYMHCKLIKYGTFLHIYWYINTYDVDMSELQGLAIHYKRTDLDSIIGTAATVSYPLSVIVLFRTGMLDRYNAETIAALLFDALNAFGYYYKIGRTKMNYFYRKTTRTNCMHFFKSLDRNGMLSNVFPLLIVHAALDDNIPLLTYMLQKLKSRKYIPGPPKQTGRDGERIRRNAFMVFQELDMILFIHAFIHPRDLYWWTKK